MKCFRKEVTVLCKGLAGGTAGLLLFHMVAAHPTDLPQGLTQTPPQTVSDSTSAGKPTMAAPDRALTPRST